MSRRQFLDPLRIAREALRSVLAQAEPHVRGTLLDVGCGRKPYASLFPRVDRHIGVDRPTSPAGRPSVEAFCDAAHLPFRAESVDSVLATEVLEHLPEPLAFLVEAERVLKPGGHVVLSTPMTWGLHEIPHDYYRYTCYGLDYLARRAGLDPLWIRPTTGAWATAGQRLASFVYHDRVNRGRPRRRRLLDRFVRVICALIQSFASRLDRIYGHRGDTLDWVMVAQRPPRGGDRPTSPLV